MSATFLVDDHLLLRVLLGEEPADLRPDGAALATTGLWYHRLCRALTDRTVVGTMSRTLGDIGDRTASATIDAIIELPGSIELVSLRSLGWPMAELLVAGAQLNLMSLEVIAAAEHLDATICLAEADDNRPLRDAARRRAVSVRTIGVL
jgi:hypothetical protein